MLDQFFSQISFVDIFNFCVFITFTICYTYQLYYVLVVLSRKPKQLVAKKNHRYAVVVSARNESAVIGDLIHSIKVQNYPTELIDVFVIADKATTRTLGVTIVGENSSEMIAMATSAVADGLTAEQWEKMIVAHPSLCEMVREAALDAFGKSVHK